MFTLYKAQETIKVPWLVAHPRFELPFPWLHDVKPDLLFLFETGISLSNPVQELAIPNYSPLTVEYDLYYEIDAYIKYSKDSQNEDPNFQFMWTFFTVPLSSSLFNDWVMEL